MRRRGSLIELLWNMIQRGERRIIRVMVLASVLLLVMQLSAVRDPLEFYVSVASKVEAPPLELPALAPADPQQSAKTWMITLKATPAAPIRVVQNGTVIANLAKGEQQIAIQSGQIQLDGIGINQTVKVQVIKRDNQLLEPRQNQIFIIQGNIQNMVIKQ
ncbi:hypothetical protein Desmer_1098 [Desulfosporosinus meridiei DSM 13257]|uniref:Uncharacterized protein n=1 Tax=Desulfosporosinus meridiei (strain ATCC BAA-275 / DSM 13257 / KCTC 12902 / NCIMB 13706 / S10) TaxID=768704 RepID=J7IND2_DESMD|nr:hypothetical protein Desmer_1098 [Desulfosporosinus meridiei DSM 13257]